MARTITDQHGERNPFFGRRHSDETKRKIGKTSLGRRHTEETKRIIGDAQRGSRNHNFGRNFSAETRQKLSESLRNPSPETRQKMRDAKIGKRRSVETCRRISEAQRGEKNRFWCGGIAHRQYPGDWSRTLRRSIRERDNYTCQVCHVPQGDGRVHDVHHIDYVKSHCDPANLVTLCLRCHRKTNYNREAWMEFFQFRTLVSEQYQAGA